MDIDISTQCRNIDNLEMGHHYIICNQRIPVDHNRDIARVSLLYKLLYQHDHIRLDLLRQLVA